MSAITETCAGPQISDNASPSTKSKYRPEIDGVRAFAVIAVIINHFNKDLLPSGYLGVDIFFVISGYVITSSLANRESKNFWDFITGFYERRIKRLVPALVVFVLVTSILICLFNPDPRTALNTGITSLFGLSNLYLFKQSTDYFAQSTELNPFTHAWSLGVEEQFYLLFPFLIWFSGFGRQAKNGARNLFLWVGALTVASLTGFIYLYQSNQPAAYFLMPPRFWEMAAGCLVFIGFQKRAKLEQALEQVPPLLVVAAMVGVMLLPISSAVPTTISIVVLSAILIACLKSGTAAFIAFTNKRLVYIGLISYSLYLWHWGILSISRWSIGIHWWSVPFQVILMLAFAACSYRFIETPARRATFLHLSEFLDRSIAIFSGIITLALSASFLAALPGFNRNNGGLYLFTVKDYENQFGKPKISRTAINQDSCMGRYSNPAALAQPDRAVIQEIIKKCSLPPQGSQTKNLFFIGDSQSDHFKSLAEVVNKQMGLGVQTAAVTSTVYPVVFYDASNGESISVQVKRAAIQEEIVRQTRSRAKSGDVIVLSGRYSAYFGSPSLPLHQRQLRLSRRLPKALNMEVTTGEFLRDWSLRLSEFLDHIDQKGVNAIIILPPPEFPYSGARCVNPLNRLNGSGQECKASRGWLLQNRSSFVEKIYHIQSRHRNLFVWDPFSSLCPESSSCLTVDKSGKSLFSDATHLSNFGARSLYPDFRYFIEKNKIIGAS